MEVNGFEIAAFANLEGANLEGADLRWADLEGATLPDYKVLPETGSFTCYKKTTSGVVELLVPASAIRVTPLTSRKCRVSEVKVVGGNGVGGTGPYFSTFTYGKGDKIVEANTNTDIREVCTKGIHVFLTEDEARNFT